MWKKSDLRCLKATQEGCLSLLGCKHQAPMTALRSPNDPAHSRAHLTLLTAPDLVQTYPGTQCLPQRGCRIPQSHTALPMGPAKPDPPGADAQMCLKPGAGAAPGVPLPALSWTWVRLWLAGPQRPLTAPTPQTCHPLKLPDGNSLHGTP